VLKFSSGIRYLKEILYLLDDDKQKLPWIFLLFLFSSLLDVIGIGLIAPYITLLFNSEAALNANLQEVLNYLNFPLEHDKLIIVLSWVLFFVFLLKGGVLIFVNSRIIVFSNQQQVKLRSYLMRAYQHQPYTTFLNRNSSEYIYAIQTLTGIFSGVLQMFLKLASEGLLALMILVLLIFSNPMILIFLLAILVIVLFSFDLFFRRDLLSYGTKSNDAVVNMVAGVHEGVDGLKEIRILGKEDYFHRKVKVNAEKNSIYNIKSQVIATIPRVLLEIIMIGFLTVTVSYTVFTGGDLNLLAPALALFGVAALRLLPFASLLSNNLVRLRYNRNAITRLYDDVFSLKSVGIVNAEKENKELPVDTFKQLSLRNISYNYSEGNQPALNSISLCINTGDSIGLIGKSGSGKTTLIDVLLGILQPQSGEIKYNGQTLNEKLNDWRLGIAYLPQQVFLIDNTLRRNIALGIDDDAIDDVRINEALKQASLIDFIEQLPDGLDTEIGERGIRISGGQRQRIAIARAFYHQRSILIMDEATSALDNETESIIVEEIKKLKGKVTLIVVAHRLSTVKNCDRIYRLDKGMIIEEGSYKNVIGDVSK
jgi:ABC-type bacteriocin/lantibiotic exporter with double-glycine peptidase domain